MNLRRCLPALALLCLVPGWLPGQTYVNAVLNAGPVGYWSFESANDASLVGSFTNTYFGNATVTAPGGGAPLAGLASNRALTLDGAGDYVRTGLDTEYTFADAVTYMGWFNLTSLPSSEGRYFVLMGKSMSGDDLDLQFHLATNALHFYTASSASSVSYAFSPALTTGTWYHVASTLQDGPSVAVRRLYINGVMVAEQTNAPLHGGHTNEFSIGDSLVFTGRYFEGLIDEVAVFDRALTSTEIGDIYAAAAIPEPSACGAVAGLLALAVARRRRR